MPSFQRRTRLPFEVKIETPCTQSWDEMTGSATTRHCDSCRKDVHNFATMTPRQIERLIQKTGGHLCARIVRYEDGTLTTSSAAIAPSYAAGFVLAASLAAGAHAQTTPRSQPPTISGVVMDQTGAGISHAQVELIQSGVVVSISKADDQGAYRFDVPAGSYTLQIASPGFLSTVQAVVLNEAHSSAVQPVFLRAGQTELGAIVVTSGAEVVEPVPVILTGEVILVDSSGQKHWYRRMTAATKRLFHLSS